MSAAPPPVAAVPAEGAPAPAEPLTPQQENTYQNAFARMEEEYTKDANEPKTPPAKEAPKEAPKAQPKAPEKPAEKPASKAPEVKADTKPGVKGDEKIDEAKSQPFDANKAAPKQLREAYEKLQAKHAELEKQHNEFKTRSADDPERKKLSETLAEREKRLQEYEEKLHYLDYSESQEFKDKYQKPFIDAYQNAQARTAKLTLAPVENEETGETTPGRKATAEDFDTLVRISDDDAAAEWAIKNFGPAKAQLVLLQREKVLELNAAKNNAISEMRAKSKEIREAQAELQKKNKQSFSETWENAGKVSKEKWPQYYEANPEDPKTDELLKTGFREAQRAFFPDTPPEQGEEPMSQAELITAQRAMYNRAAAFPRITYELQLANKRVSELEEKLKAFEDSQPGPGEGKGQKAPEPKVRTALGAFDERFPG